jgi:hypothetical protein
MQDPNFEKTVQQKMEELQFLPAESVWVNIDKAVAGQRYRRGLPVFWRIALPLVVAAAATGGYLINRPSDKQASVQGVSRPSLVVPGAGLAANATTTAPISNESVAASKAPAYLGSSLRKSFATSEGKAGMSGSAKVAGSDRFASANAAGGNRFASKNGAGKDRIASANEAGINRIPSTNKVGKNGDGEAQRDDVPTGAKRAGVAGTGVARTGVAQGGSVQEDAASGAGGAVIVTAQEPRKVRLFQPEFADQRRMQAIRAAQLNNRKAAIAIAGLQKRSRPWEAGFVAGGGISRLNRLNAAQAAAAVSTTAISFYNINGSSQGKAYIADERSNASFSGGIYLQKELSDRLTVNTGMMLHYFSSGITIGQQVNTYVQASASFFNPAALATVPSAAVYSAGNQRSFINRYYFLELPLNVQWQVNKSHLLPLFLEGGFSLARVMSANALLYDAETGVYSKQGEQINKTQLYLSTAFMAGLPIHGLHVKAGPQVQYGLTPIVDNHGLGDQHFFYAGLKVVVIPGKK